MPLSQATEQAHPSTPSSTSNSAATSYVLQNGASPSLPHNDWYKLWVPPGFAFLGVIIALVWKWRGDARKRKLRMKQKLYMKVADAINEGGIVLGSMGNPAQPFDQIMGRLTSAQAPLSKAEVVAGMPLVAALATLRNSANSAVFEMLEARMSMDRLTGMIRNIDPIINQIQEKIDGNLAEQRRINIDGGHPDPQRFARLQNDFSSLQHQQSEYIEKNNAHYNAIKIHTLSLGQMAVKAMTDLVPLQARVLELIRKELNLDSDFNKAEYLRIRNGMTIAATEALKKAQDAAERVYRHDD